MVRNEFTRFDSGKDNRNTLPRFMPQAMRETRLLGGGAQSSADREGRPRHRSRWCGCLRKKPWIVPIPSTTKLARLEENLRAVELELAPREMLDLEMAVSEIPIVGDRYPAAQQRQVER